MPIVLFSFQLSSQKGGACVETRIRKARKADVPELAELLKLFREEHSRLIGGDKTVDTKETLKEAKTNIEKTARGYFVAEL